MSSSPIRSGKASKVIGIALASVTLSFGIVAAAATASGAATPATTRALPAPKCTGCSAGPKGAVAVLSAAQTPSTPLTVHDLRPHATSVDTPNWSGYVATGGPYYDVWGQWTVPTATCTAGGNSASTTWVGLGTPGGTSTVVQIGTTSACVNGQPEYAVWLSPAQALPVNYTVQPGNVMSGFVQASSSNPAGTQTQYTLKLTDNSNTLPVPAHLTLPGGEPASAEWITAWPIGSSQLTNFGTVNFSQADATGPGFGIPIEPISYWPHTAVYMDNSEAEAVPGGLYGNGTDFSDVWIHPGQAV